MKRSAKRVQEDFAAFRRRQFTPCPGCGHYAIAHGGRWGCVQPRAIRDGLVRCGCGSSEVWVPAPPPVREVA